LLGTKDGEAEGITWGLWVEMEQFSDRFKNAQDGAVTSTAERYLAAAATVGYAY
jgi:hypothetical protein